MMLARPVLLRDFGRLGTHWEPLPLFPPVPPPCPITDLRREESAAGAESHSESICSVPSFCRTDPRLDSPGATGGTGGGPGALAPACFLLLCPRLRERQPRPHSMRPCGVGKGAPERGGGWARAAGGRGRVGASFLSGAREGRCSRPWRPSARVLELRPQPLERQKAKPRR